MLKIIVDSGSSIKQEEKELYGVDVIPLKILLGEKEYDDGVDLSLNTFYDELINNHRFPKTSLPSLYKLNELVENYINNGDEVIIITISSGISGTYQAIHNMYIDNEKVLVIDSQTAVGGVRLIVSEINKYRHLSLKEIENKVNELIPKIQVVAVPETLEYLHKGGRLKKSEYYIGTILKIKPIIGIFKSKVHVFAKVIGLTRAMKRMNDALLNCDEKYEIIPSYTYDKSNLEKMISKLDEKYKKLIKIYDNLDPAIACHWGPNAFGYIFVAKGLAKESI